MKSDVPPTSALVAFEALSRHLSFSRAAQELSVTPGAVSRQIHALEEVLGVALFERTNRTVRLTSAGSRYLADVQGALQTIGRATREMRGAPGPSLSISVLPSFASRWLVPRLPAFVARHPGVDLRITATQAIVAPGNGGPDLCLRYGPGPWPSATLLAVEQLYPVCAPGVLRDGPSSAQGLPDGIPLLRDTHEPWDGWLFKAQAGPSPNAWGPRFDDSALLLQAAEAGQGIALGRHLLVKEAVEKGRLARISNVTVPSRNSYFLASAPEAQLSQSAKLFAQWLQTEVARDLTPAAGSRA